MLLDWKQECPKWETTVMDLGTYAIVPPLWANLKKCLGRMAIGGLYINVKKNYFSF